MRTFSNGPLPSEFEAAAYITSSEQEFALPRTEVIQYLLWCQRTGLRVLGFDTWKATEPGPIPLAEGFNAEAEVCIAKLKVEPERFGVVYNI